MIEMVLRPLRYTITKDKFLFAGSETGMIELDEKNYFKRKIGTWRNYWSKN